MRRLIVATFMALLGMSLVMPTLAAPPGQEEDGEVYTIQAGDWLSKLAEKYYGDPLAYSTIVEATNARAAGDTSFSLINNPDLIEVGQKLWIPAQAGQVVAPPPASTPQATSPQLTGVVWRWQQTLMNNGDIFSPDNPNNYTVQFLDDGTVSIQADCNQGSGTYTVQDSALTLTLGPMTLVACPPGSLGDRFTANLSQAAIYFFEGGNLLIDLMVDSGTMRFSPQFLELAGTSWTVTGYNNDQAAVVSLLAETEITADFGLDGRLTGSAGCNTYTAAYQTEGNTVSIGPAASTRMACPQPEGVMEQETAYLAALETAATYQLRGDRLELRTADGALAVTFAASGQAGSSSTPEASVSGTLTYLQRIALPPNAVAEVKLVDVSRQDAEAIVLGEQIITNLGQVPIAFGISYDPGAIDPAHTYAIQARITVDGQPRFLTTTAYPVITQDMPTTVEVILEQVN